MKPIRRKRVVFPNASRDNVTPSFARLAVHRHERALVAGRSEGATSLERLTPRACSCEVMAVRQLETPEQRRAMLLDGLHDVEIAAGAMSLQRDRESEEWESLTLVARAAHALDTLADREHLPPGALAALRELVTALEAPARRAFEEAGCADAYGWNVTRSSAARTL